jgi:hypothetical protein
MDPRVPDDSSLREAGLGARANYGVGVAVLVAALAAVVIIVGFFLK